MEQPNESRSLILRQQAELEAAPFLFSGQDLPKIDKSKPKFHCTGERLWRDRPDVYKAVVRLLAEPGISIRSICATLHVTDDTVRAVKERENIAIAAEKKTVLANITHGLRLASERVIETIPDASPKDALLGVGILTDKMQLLSGEPTERVEEIASVNVFERFRILTAELKAKAAEKTGVGSGKDFLTEGSDDPAAIIDVEAEAGSPAATNASSRSSAEAQA